MHHVVSNPNISDTAQPQPIDRNYIQSPSRRAADSIVPIVSYTVPINAEISAISGKGLVCSSEDCTDEVTSFIRIDDDQSPACSSCAAFMRWHFDLTRDLWEKIAAMSHEERDAYEEEMTEVGLRLEELFRDIDGGAEAEIVF